VAGNLPPSHPRGDEDGGDEEVQFDNVENPGSEWLKAIPLFPEDVWGEASPDDSWCFLCRRTNTHSGNAYYGNLTRLFKNESGKTKYDMCCAVQTEFTRTFYDYLAGDQKKMWTLRSIRAHADEHGGMDDDAKRRELRGVAYRFMQEITRSMAMVQDTRTGETWPTKAGIDMWCKVLASYTRLGDKSNV